MISVHNIFYINIVDESQKDVIVALYVALERIIQDHLNTARAAGSNNNN